MKSLIKGYGREKRLGTAALDHRSGKKILHNTAEVTYLP
jgi:hypothetical protein